MLWENVRYENLEVVIEYVINCNGICVWRLGF